MNDIDFILKGQPQENRTVYIMEPNDDIIAFVKRIFICEGFELGFFMGIDDLKKKCKVGLPSIIYIGLGQKNGVDIIKEIKANDRLKKVTLIASGITKDAESKSYEAGADIYIPKPLLFKRLPLLIKASQYDISFS